MSFAFINDLFEFGDGLSSSEFWVLMAICHHVNASEADRSGSCFPSTARISAKAHVSELTVRKTIKALEAKGLIKTSQPSGGLRTFIVSLDAIRSLPGAELIKDPKGCKDLDPPKDVEGGKEVAPPKDVEGDPVKIFTSSPSRSLPTPLKDLYPEHRKEQGIEQGKEQWFFVEPPSGGFDDEAPAGLFDDELEKVDRPSSRIPACPYKKLVDLYHEVCPMLPTVTVLTPGRKTQLKARWTEIYREEHCTSEAECLENFRFIFNRVAASRFLTGRTDPGPGRSRPFVANLDWLIKAANFVKVCENRYSN